MRFDEREAVYGRDEYYWGTDPTELAELVLEYLPEDPSGRRLVDIGAGEGRDVVYYAEHGLDACAIDISPAGLEKARELAEDRGVEISTCQANANVLTFPDPVDILTSCGAVQYIRPEIRPRQFERFRDATIPGGLHGIFAFENHPDIPRAPDMTDNEYRFEPGELDGYYDDWETLHSEQVIFEDDSGGVPHKHAARILIARAPE